ncbi:MAG TPA: pre-toxin TG domain-containing protein, partial [Ferruginibacter sp.]|uniref:pre-toxin TG domain-containing protein n=1 Tax=Nitrosomonas europaea TaxID=915 RepID=UPI002C6CA2F1
NFNDPSGLSAAAASMLLGKLGSWGRENAGTLAEIGIGFTPAGVYADIYSAVAGRSLITGDSLSGWERALVLIPGVSEIRNAGRVVSAAGPIVGGGAKLENISAGEITRIQNAANRTGTEISVVGSRANGTSGPASDWDFVVPDGTRSRTVHSLSSSLPEGSRGLGEQRNQDIFKGTVDQSMPFITFKPQ